MPDPSRPIRRPEQGRMIGGVCAGLGQWLGWDASVVRVIYVLGSFLTGLAPGALAYLVLWLILPSESATPGASSAAPPKS